jgi:hypothetical protein
VLLPVDDQQRLAVEDEKALLMRLVVATRLRLA